MSNTTGRGGADMGMIHLDQFSDEEIMRRMRAVMGEPMNPLTEPLVKGKAARKAKFVAGAITPAGPKLMEWKR